MKITHVAVNVAARARRSSLPRRRPNGRRQLARPGAAHDVRRDRGHRLHRLSAPGSHDDDRGGRAGAGRAAHRHERARAGGGVGAPGPARRLGRPRRPAALRPGARSTSRCGTPSARRSASRSTACSADIRDRLPTYASDGLWYSLSPDELAAAAKAPRGAGLRRGEAAPGPRGDAGAGSASSPGRARGRRPGRADHGRHQRDLVAARRPAAADARCRMRASRGWKTRSIISTWPVSPTCAASSRSRSRPASISITSTRFAALLEARAVDVLILDLARVGGVTPWRRIAALAQAHGVPVCGHVVPEIQVHLLAVDRQRPPRGVCAALGRHPRHDAADRERRAGGALGRRASASSSTTRPCGATRSA